jgi:peptide/nickel transport system substrate-binding protein
MPRGQVLSPLILAYALLSPWSETARAETPIGVNRDWYLNPKVDAIIDETKHPKKQDALIASAHEAVVDDAALLGVVHGTNAQALSPGITNFIQAQHWFQDLTTIDAKR